MRGLDIRKRLLLLALAPAALIVVVQAVYFTHSRIADLNHSLRAHGTRMVANLGPVCEHGVVAGDPELLRPLLNNIVSAREVRAVSVFDVRHQPLIEVRDSDDGDARGWREGFAGWYSGLPPVLAFRGEIRQLEPSPADLREGVERPAGKAGRLVGWVKVELTTTPTLIRQAEMLSNGLLYSLLVLLAAAAVAIRAGRDISRPVIELTEVVRRLEKGELSARVAGDPRGDTELATLGRGINAMADALEHSHRTMRDNIERATGELRETLEAVEVQNVELDIARKRALEASRVKSEFLSSMSHEIRTPMNGIIGFSNLLIRTPLSETQHDYAQTIRESASNLLTIINDILDFSKVESGQLTLEALPFDLRELIEEAMALLAPLAYEKGLEIVELIYSDVPTRLIGDPVRIRQVLTNLVGNAIKFTKEGRVVVRVMVEGEESDPVQLRVTVSDTGVGIPRERRRGLFDAFSQGDASVTRRFGGTGLGLAICKRLVQQMLGDIGVDGGDDRGSTFWFTLRCERQLGKEPETLREALAGKAEVLLVEPQHLARLALVHRFNRWGMAVSEVDDAEAIARRLAEEGERLVVWGADGEGAEGLAEPIARWRGVRPEVRVVVLVNSVDQALHDRIRAVGADLVLPKIFREENLAREMERLLDPRWTPPTGEAEVDEERQTPAAESRPRGDRFVGLRILAVDDNPINLLLTTTLLREEGATVVEADGGERAVARAAEGGFDLILMDIQMPDISGVEATRRIRDLEGEGPRTPIVAVTAHALPGEQESFLQAGMDDCLVKPLGEDSLRRTVRHWTGTAAEAAGESPAVEETEARPAYDEVLALKLAGGSPELAERLIGMLLRDLDERRRTILDAHAEKDLEALRERVHKLQGSAASCGATALRHAARVLESTLDEGGELAALVEELDGEVSRLLAFGEERFATS